MVWLEASSLSAWHELDRSSSRSFKLRVVAAITNWFRASWWSRVWTGHPVTGARCGSEVGGPGSRASRPAAAALPPSFPPFLCVPGDLIRIQCSRGILVDGVERGTHLTHEPLPTENAGRYARHHTLSARGSHGFISEVTGSPAPARRSRLQSTAAGAVARAGHRTSAFPTPTRGAACVRDFVRAWWRSVRGAGVGVGLDGVGFGGGLHATILRDDVRYKFFIAHPNALLIIGRS